MISARLASGVFVCGKHFNVASFEDAINLIKVRLDTMVVIIELNLSIPFPVILTIFQVPECLTVFTENLVFLFNEVKTFRVVK